MGWTIYNRSDSPKTKAKEAEEIAKIMAPNQVLKSLKIGAVWYVAISRPTSMQATDDDKGISCYVILTRKSQGEWAYKEIHERMGPAESKCPQSILRMLTPLTDNDDNKYAIEWRERCETYHKRPMPVVGDVVEFDKPLTFAGKKEGRIFKKIDLAGYRSVYTCLDNASLGTVRLSSEAILQCTIRPRN